MDFIFFFNSILLGVGLAMDAFSVSLANGLNEPHMRRRKLIGIATVFAGFQTMMPLIGWFLVHTAVSYFNAFEKFIPYIALILLAYIGFHMIKEGKDGEGEDTQEGRLTISLLLIQGIATSIDALSVGFTIVEYDIIMATISSLIIGVVTFAICVTGVIIGKKFGTVLAGKASIMGGIILIVIGIEIFIKGIM